MPVLAAIVGGVVGWAVRVTWPQPETFVEATGPSVSAEPAPEFGSSPAPSVVAVSDQQILAQAVLAGCDCPRSAPPETDSLYLEPAVTAWFDEVMDKCPAFAARARRRLDCLEWPCMLAVSDNGGAADMMLLFQEKKVPGASGKGMTCGIEGPNLVSLGGHGLGSMDWYFAIRPEESDQDHRREGIRMYAQRPEHEPPR